MNEKHRIAGADSVWVARRPSSAHVEGKWFVERAVRGGPHISACAAAPRRAIGNHAARRVHARAAMMCVDRTAKAVHTGAARRLLPAREMHANEVQDALHVKEARQVLSIDDGAWAVTCDL